MTPGSPLKQLGIPICQSEAKKVSYKLRGALKPPQVRRHKVDVRANVSHKTTTHRFNGEHPAVRKALHRVARCLSSPHFKVLRLLQEAPDTKWDKDSKIDKQILELKEDLAAAREMMRAALGNKPITVMLYERYTATSGVATAYSTVKNLVPGGGGQFSSFAALFDEYKCVGVHTPIRCCPNVNSSQTTQPMWLVAYDWGVAGALTSITSGMAQTNHIYGIVDLGSNQTIIADGKFGFFHLNARIPKGVMADVGIITDLMSGLWVPTSDAAAIVGYLKPYIEAAPAAGVMQLQGVIGYEVEFRCRG